MKISASASFSRKNSTVLSKTPQYSFLCLVTQHQYPFATITHFSAISFPATMKLSSKTSMMYFALTTLASLPGCFNCCLEQVYCRNLAPVSVKRNSAGDVTSGVLKTRKAEGFSLQVGNLLKRNSIKVKFL